MRERHHEQERWRQRRRRQRPTSHRPAAWHRRTCVNETTDGTEELPSAAGSTRASPSLTTATQEFEVPRSMPTTARAVATLCGYSASCNPVWAQGLFSRAHFAAGSDRVQAQLLNYQRCRAHTPRTLRLQPGDMVIQCCETEEGKLGRAANGPFWCLQHTNAEQTA